MQVIKLGGSLAESGRLVACLDKIADLAATAVIVPGGGAFAEQVRLSQRRFQFNDRTAHVMAILAMQQMAWLLAGLKPTWPLLTTTALLQTSLQTGQTVIWIPDWMELDAAGIPASWDVTSDSLAVWLTQVLSAPQLLLLKSAAIDPAWTWPMLAGQGIVDGAFVGFAQTCPARIQVLNADLWLAST